MTRCALCPARHENSTVCDDCAERVAADLDADRDDGAADALRDVLRDAGCDYNVARIDEVRAARAIVAAPDDAQVRGAMATNRWKR